MSEQQTSVDKKSSHSKFGLSSLKTYINNLIHSKHMLYGVTLASFLESIIVPIPLEAMLVPLMQARREKLIAISTAALLGCMLGATTGYALGYFVFDMIGDQLIALFSSQQQFDMVKQKMDSGGFWFVFSVGVIPIPFQIAMLAAGVTKYSFVLFITASVLSRALRYFGLALLVKVAGNRAEEIFKKHKLTASILLTFVFLGAWILATFL